MTRAVLLVCAVSLAGCGWWSNPANPGNPGNTPYVGEPGSIVDLSGPLRPVRPEPVSQIPPLSPTSTLPPVSSTPLPPPRP
jgi:hypothetical protein